MEQERGWQFVGDEGSWSMRGAGMGLLRATLLFGLGIAALTILIVPVLDKRSDQWADGAGIDTMQVGSINKGNTYTLRRSVLQPSPDSVCVIRPDGSRRGAC
ncbi:MAG: hypothetical protein M9924_10605 [Rhizobiaceae bacterium]|nr:hypothetical protein [Rhizobiaceae bacterium]